LSRIRETTPVKGVVFSIFTVMGKGYKGKKTGVKRRAENRKNTRAKD